jgi:hypothetical protein
MPLKLNVGLSKKLGLPDYGSLGASCYVEIELDQTLIVSDLDGFHERVRRTFTACRQAVDDELSRYRSAGAEGPGATLQSSPAAARDTNGTGNQRNGNGHSASDKQVGFARQLATDIDGLGPRKLDALAKKMFGKAVGALSVIEASGLIDTLKSIKTGKIDLSAALDGTAERKGAAA